MFKNILNKKNNKSISYSQSGEDLIVKYIFKNILRDENFSILDIGAHDPISLNNTYLFYKKSKIWSVDANPMLINKFNKVRKSDNNLNLAISDRDHEIDYYQMSASTLNTFSKERAHVCQVEHGVKIENILKVKAISLESLINLYCSGKFPDFLSLDVEGYEELIINQLIGMKTNPKVICVETALYKGENHIGVKNNTIIKKLTDANYIHYGDTFINSIFIRNDLVEKNK